MMGVFAGNVVPRRRTLFLDLVVELEDRTTLLIRI